MSTYLWNLLFGLVVSLFQENFVPCYRQKVLNDEDGSQHAQIVALRAVCCGALTRLLLDGNNAQLIAQVNK